MSEGRPQHTGWTSLHELQILRYWDWGVKASRQPSASTQEICSGLPGCLVVMVGFKSRPTCLQSCLPSLYGLQDRGSLNDCNTVSWLRALGF